MRAERVGVEEASLPHHVPTRGSPRQEGVGTQCQETLSPIHPMPGGRWVDREKLVGWTNLPPRRRVRGGMYKVRGCAAGETLTFESEYLAWVLA